MLKPGIVRLLLALVVVFYHSTKFVYLGHFSVLCFFILSGYWITVIYDTKYKKQENGVASFYLSRLWRLLPVFILLNAAAILLYQYYNPGWQRYYESLTLISSIFYWIPNILIIGFNFLERPVLIPAWSLDIELQFYLLFPIMISFIYKKIAHLKTIILIFFIISLFLSIFYSNSLIAKTIIYYIPYFLIGIYIYLKKLQFARKTEVIFLFLFFAALAVNYFIPYLRALTVYNNASNYNRYLNDYLPLLLVPFITNSVKTNKSSKLDRTLGNVSYVLYLAHWVLIIPYLYYTKNFSFNEKLVATIIYLLSTFFISYVVYILFDKPIDSLRRRWTERQ